MVYITQRTDTFNVWLKNLKDKRAVIRILSRISRVEDGNFGDIKPVGDNVFEMRFFFGSGYRVYYTIKNNVVVFLLNGGDKDSQKKDIKKAKIILNELE